MVTTRYTVEKQKVNATSRIYSVNHLEMNHFPYSYVRLPKGNQYAAWLFAGFPQLQIIQFNPIDIGKFMSIILVCIGNLFSHIYIIRTYITIIYYHVIVGRYPKPAANHKFIGYTQIWWLIITFRIKIAILWHTPFPDKPFSLGKNPRLLIQRV